MPKSPTLTELRSQTELSQAALGRAIGVSATTISEWEHGKQAVPTARIPALATALQTTESIVAAAAEQATGGRIRASEQMLLDVAALIRARTDIRDKDLKITIATLRTVAALEEGLDIGGRIMSRTAVVCRHADFVARHLAGGHHG